MRLGAGVELLNRFNAEVVVRDANWLVMLRALLRTGAAVHELVQAIVWRRAHQLLLMHSILMHLVFCLLEGVVGLGVGVLLVALFLLIRCLVLGQVNEVKRRNMNIVNVLELRLLLDVQVELHILVAVV